MEHWNISSFIISKIDLTSRKPKVLRLAGNIDGQKFCLDGNVMTESFQKLEGGRELERRPVVRQATTLLKAWNIGRETSFKST